MTYCFFLNLGRPRKEGITFCLALLVVQKHSAAMQPGNDFPAYAMDFSSVFMVP